MLCARVVRGRRESRAVERRKKGRMMEKGGGRLRWRLVQREGVDCLSIINGDAGYGKHCVVALITDKETEFVILKIVLFGRDKDVDVVA